VLATTLLATAGGTTPAPARQVDPTPLDEIVMYTIDADTDELLRYRFDTDEITLVGVVQDGAGNVLEDCEALAWIPDGPHIGMYCAPGLGAHANKLARVELISATATVRPTVIMAGSPHLNGLFARKDAATGAWTLMATLSGSNDLLEIDPATGAGTVVATLSRPYAGLAEASDGTIYAVKGDDLWRIDPATYAETLVGTQAFTKLEALEFGFGLTAPLLDTATAPAAWTANGALISFCDDNDAFLILDPATGASVQHFTSFTMVDCEGIAFLHESLDPFTAVVANAFD
jgi:hypothetical protein